MTCRATDLMKPLPGYFSIVTNQTCLVTDGAERQVASRFAHGMEWRWQDVNGKATRGIVTRSSMQTGKRGIAGDSARRVRAMATTSERTLRIPEREFLRQIRDLANVFGWKIYHTHNSKHSEKGYPDVTLVRDGDLIFSELKTNSGRLTPEQTQWIEALGQCRTVEACIWRPSQWDRIVERLRK